MNVTSVGDAALPLSSYLNGIFHSHPTTTHFPPQPCAPHPVSGGDQLCQSRQATHTRSGADKAAGAANEAELFLRRARPLFSFPGKAKAWHRCCHIPHQDNRFLGGEEPVPVRRELFWAFLPLRNWDAGGAQREQQVGKTKSWDCFHGDQEFVSCWWA